MLRPPKPSGRLATFGRDKSGSVGILFALSLVPVVAMAGAAVDYSRTVRDRASLQSALDTAVLAGAKDGSESWTATASKAFASHSSANAFGTISPPTFSKAQTTYSGAVTERVPTTLMNVVGIAEIEVTVRASATVQLKPDNSCLLSFDTGQAKSHEAITFNGAPNVSLVGCTMRSNSSIRCNGHSTNASGSIAVGTVSGCSNPQSHAAAVPDIWAAMAANITTSCASSPGANWSPGSAPTSPKMVTVQKGTHTEYHVCGDLTLSGNGSLSGLSTSADSVIVIENGSLTLAADASITLPRTAVILTGDDTKPSKIEFPNGNGKAATLNLSPPTNSSNPWRGVSIYQDPKLTDVDEDFGPGATLNLDGLVYLPNADVTLRGNAGGGNPVCSKLVVKTFTSNGSVSLRQTEQGCAALGVTQWQQVQGVLITQ